MKAPLAPSLAIAVIVTASLSFSQISLQAQSAPVGYTDTPMLPGGKWHVHDPARPQPRIVTPGSFSTANEPGKPPSDAIILFDGKDLSKWRTSTDKTPTWKIEDGTLIVAHDANGKGQDIYTRDAFGDCQLHVEFATPNPPKGDSQGRGNSGIFFMDLYEFQVLDGYQNRTYADGGAGSLYGQTPPLVNASRPPGEWQVYDLIFTAPRFKNGKLESPAYITAFHNGVLVQNHTAYMGPTVHKKIQHYRTHPATKPIRIQDHGDPVRYRNLWIRSLQTPEAP